MLSESYILFCVSESASEVSQKSSVLIVALNDDWMTHLTRAAKYLKNPLQDYENAVLIATMISTTIFLVSFLSSRY